MNKTNDHGLAQALQANGYDLTASQQERLVQYVDLLARWNKVFNLTAIRDPYEMVWLHLLDSLAISPYIRGETIIDVGTGAGLPGIPLALIFPEKHFVLLDSNSKKTHFLIQACAELGLKNTQVEHARCETFQAPKGFDNIVSRAFSSIAVMLSATQHLLAPGGQFLAMKGVYPEQELAAVSPEGFAVSAVHQLQIKGLAALRHVVCIEKNNR